MTLKELMKMYDLKLEVGIIERKGSELISVTLSGAGFHDKKTGGCGISTFPGWGNTLNQAVSDLIVSIREYTHIVVPYGTGVTGEVSPLPLPRITSFS